MAEARDANIGYLKRSTCLLGGIPDGSVDLFGWPLARSLSSDIMILSGDQLPEALDTVRAEGREAGFEIVTDALDAAEFRWHVEKGRSVAVGQFCGSRRGSGCSEADNSMRMNSLSSGVSGPVRSLVRLRARPLENG